MQVAPLDFRFRLSQDSARVVCVYNHSVEYIVSV